jgi:hypothetical protein
LRLQRFAAGNLWLGGEEVALFFALGDDDPGVFECFRE